jgi:hypothetical protein
MTVEVQSSSRDVDVPVADEPLIEDWLELAGYLAEAIAAGEATVHVARAELAAAADDVVERQALDRAAEVATTQLGDDALIATLLRWATIHAERPAEAA